MTTRLCDDPQLAYLGVGDELPVDTARALAGGYLLLREPEPDDDRPPAPVDCPACGYAYNWAEVVVTDGVITSIRAVDLNQAALARAHFIVHDARDIAADLAGVRATLDLDSNQVEQSLRERLPTEGGWRLGTRQVAYRPSRCGPCPSWPGCPPDPGSLSVGYWSRRLRRSSEAALSSSACRTSWWVCCS